MSLSLTVAAQKAQKKAECLDFVPPSRCRHRTAGTVVGRELIVAGR